MPTETIFSKIIRREIPADIVYQDDQVTAFRDINPQAPVHILVVPNKLIPTANDVTPRTNQCSATCSRWRRKVAEQEGIAESGYRLLVNCNRDGGQEVYHLHMHLRSAGSADAAGLMVVRAELSDEDQNLCVLSAAACRASMRWTR